MNIFLSVAQVLANVFHDCFYVFSLMSLCTHICLVSYNIPACPAPCDFFFSMTFSAYGHFLWQEFQDLVDSVNFYWAYSTSSFLESCEPLSLSRTGSLALVIMGDIWGMKPTAVACSEIVPTQLPSFVPVFVCLVKQCLYLRVRR